MAQLNRPDFVSLGPVFSEAPDCPQKVRQRQPSENYDYFGRIVTVLWSSQAGCERARNRMRTVEGLVLSQTVRAIGSSSLRMNLSAIKSEQPFRRPAFLNPSSFSRLT